MGDICVDYNHGATVFLPGGKFRVKITDKDTGKILLDTYTSEQEISTYQKYYVNFRVEVYQGTELLLDDNIMLPGKDVYITFPPTTLGDSIAWVASVEKFREKHSCNVFCSVSNAMAELLRFSYPDIVFITDNKAPKLVYATYHLGFWRPPEPNGYQPADWRTISLQQVANRILGLDDDEIRAKIKTSKERLIKEKYVCIATQSTAQCKYWNNPDGWMELVDYLKGIGYRVLCIDKCRKYGAGDTWNDIPENAEDFTGALPLQERADILAHADFFIGLGSGLSWLAWAVGVPVVMISGFSLPFSEFYTPYRVINTSCCHGCWNDTGIVFRAKEWEWCPRGKGFECSKEIKADDVIKVIKYLIEKENLKML